MTSPPFGSPTQAELALSEGSVFFVRENDLYVVATTSPDPISGLVLYDLSSCLRQIAGVGARKRRAKAPGSAPKGTADRSETEIATDEKAKGDSVGTP